MFYQDVINREEKGHPPQGGSGVPKKDKKPATRRAKLKLTLLLEVL